MHYPIHSLFQLSDFGRRTTPPMPLPSVRMYAEPISAFARPERWDGRERRNPDLRKTYNGPERRTSPA